MLERMTLLVFRNRRITADRVADVPMFGVRTGMQWIAVVCVYDVASGAAAGAIVARMLVRAEEVQMGIVQTCLVQVDERRRHTQPRAAAAVPQAEVGAARFIKSRRIAD